MKAAFVSSNWTNVSTDSSEEPYFTWTEKVRSSDPMYDIRVKRMLIEEFNPR
jgi:hypothetical protein